MSKKKGFSFGDSRDKCIFGALVKKNETKAPGPQKYILKTTLSKLSYSMGEKQEANLNKSKTPGPGNYSNVLALNKECRYPISTYRTFGQRIIHPPNIKEICIKGQMIPGPGSYEMITSISPNGRYPISKWGSSKVRSFSISSRNTYKNEKCPTPGPGHYPIYSEFG